MTITDDEISKAMQMIREIMREEGVDLDDAEKKAVERYGNAITFDLAKLALRPPRNLI